MGESLNGVPGLDIDAERRVVDERLAELQREGSSDKATSIAMKELGIQRLAAQHHIYIRNTHIDPFSSVF